MSEERLVSTAFDKKQRLLALFERMLPLVDGLADKLRLILILGFMVVCWIGAWLFFFKQYHLTISLLIVSVALIPLLVIFRFWWSIEALKDLPAIADQMLGDAKNELRGSIQGLQAGTMPKLGFLGAAKGLWSIGAMAMEARELIGSYVSIATLINPFMLVLGIVSLLCVVLLIFIGLLLLFFV